MLTHPIDAYHGGLWIGDPCDQCANRADVIITDVNPLSRQQESMALCLDCSPRETS